ncbi:hypothetical protein P171DRAFT_349784, partial [Karstenula rhodostoma CBS 690.94]
KEIIVSCGAQRTLQPLMLSGIGPRNEPQSLSVKSRSTLLLWKKEKEMSSTTHA